MNIDWMQEDIDEFNRQPQTSQERRLKRQMKGMYPYLDALDWLLIYPEFHQAVEKVRNKLNIDVKSNLQEVSELLGEQYYDAFVNEDELIRRLQATGELINDKTIFPVLGVKPQELDDIRLTVDNWSNSKFSVLQKEIAHLRTVELGRVPYSWQHSIAKYVLFGLRQPQQIYEYETLPQMSLEHDHDSGEPYIQIKIYGDGRMEFLRSKEFKSKYRALYKQLPKYFKAKNTINDAMYRRYLIAYLLTVEKDDIDKINKKLAELYLAPVEEDNLSKEIYRRFKSYLITPKPKKNKSK